MYKCEPLLTRFRHRCERTLNPGKLFSFDEQTIGYQGRESDAKRHKDKAEGDGYQNDAICVRGYTWSWIWRHEEPPKIHPHLKPTYQRVLWLFQRLKEVWPLNRNYVAYADNLYIKDEFLFAAKQQEAPWAPVFVNGTARKGGRGFPSILLEKFHEPI